MDVAAVLDRLESQREFRGCLVHHERLPARPGRFAAPARPLAPRIASLLSKRGIDDLYSHQAAACDAAAAGRDFVVVTGTSSGKTLCYHLPILEATAAEPDARALYLYPTKALAQDQLKGLLELLEGDASLGDQLAPGVYDGDTPPAQRRRIKAEAQLVLSNPDMLHAGVLPHHAKWARFFAELRYVVLDEVHAYRGILGANVGCVLRRLMRVCRHYGAEPIFLAASATVANPGDFVSRLLGRPVQVIDEDGAPRGAKHFVLWNPQPLGADRLARRSAADDAVALLAEVLEEGGQALAFTRTRQSAELIHRYLKDRLYQENSPHEKSVRAYRGGYLPNERRQIEQDLFSGKLRAVAATNALELGVDVGSLDAAILVGYPGAIASAWQQAGRAGRRCNDSLAVLIAGNDPVDQYLMRRPEYFFAQTPEHAVVDPENPYVLARHLKSAAFELPLEPDDAALFGVLTEPIVELLADSGELHEVGGKFYYSGGVNPAIGVSLRHMSDNTFAIVLQGARTAPGEPPPADRRSVRGPGPSHAVIANVDAISAPELVYPEAVYLHGAETYLVRELDLQGKVAYVERRETDYYTQAVLESRVRIERTRREQPDSPYGGLLAFGDAEVAWQTVAYKKIKFATRENIGLGPVNIPEQTLETTAFWYAPSDAMRAALKGQGRRPSEALAGLRNLAVTALPMIAMCDPRDISGVVDSQNLGRSAMILYDRYPGGLGYCEKGCERFAEILRICRDLVADCPCEDGCPSCVGLPNLRPAIHSDPDLSRGYPIPDKAAAHALVELMLAAAAPGVRAG